jgi:hypothetical protein
MMRSPASTTVSDLAFRTATADEPASDRTYVAQSTMNSVAPVSVEDRCAASPKSETW